MRGILTAPTRLAILIAGCARLFVDRLVDLASRTSSIRYFLVSHDYPKYITRGNAAMTCQFHAQRFCKGKGVDVGAARWPFPGARAIDDGAAENALRINESDNSLDYVFSSHCLEHISDWKSALREWTRVIKPNGVLYLYLPHPAAKLWASDVLKFHAWNPDPITVEQEVSKLGFKILSVSDFPDAYLSFHLVAQKKG